MSKKSNKYPSEFIANVLIYNDKFINYRQGAVIRVDEETPYIEEVTRICDNTRRYIPPMVRNINMGVSNYGETENIELDPTTMKRIAVYNKTQECRKLDKEIKEKEERIKELDDVLTDKEKRVDMLKKYIANIFDIEIKEDNDDDYGDYDW